MQTVDLSAYLAEVERRKAAIGLGDTPSRTEAMRNKGGNRTPQKRELLRRADARARLVGQPAVVSYF